MVLTEALTGDHRRVHQNRLLRACDIREVDEELARAAAVRRTWVGVTPIPSGVDAVVMALADSVGGAAVLTSDPGDLRALARHTTNHVRISSS